MKHPHYSQIQGPFKDHIYIIQRELYWTTAAFL